MVACDGGDDRRAQLAPTSEREAAPAPAAKPREGGEVSLTFAVDDGLLIDASSSISELLRRFQDGELSQNKHAKQELRVKLAALDERLDALPAGSYDASKGYRP